MWVRVLFVSVLVLLGACSKSDEKIEDHVWKEKTDTIDKARDVEQPTLDSAAQQREQINKQEE